MCGHPALPKCKCKANWISPDDGVKCNQTQYGCARNACDHDWKSWCVVETLPCSFDDEFSGVNTGSYGGNWIYCTPNSTSNDKGPQDPFENVVATRDFVTTVNSLQVHCHTTMNALKSAITNATGGFEPMSLTVVQRAMLRMSSNFSIPSHFATELHTRMPEASMVVDGLTIYVNRSIVSTAQMELSCALVTSLATPAMSHHTCLESTSTGLSSNPALQPMRSILQKYSSYSSTFIVRATFLKAAAQHIASGVTYFDVNLSGGMQTSHCVKRAYEAEYPHFQCPQGMQTERRSASSNQWWLAQGNSSVMNQPLRVAIPSQTPKCTCAANWTSVTDGDQCGSTQYGCPTKACDKDAHSWCVVNTSPCMDDNLQSGVNHGQHGGNWIYCTPD